MTRSRHRFRRQHPLIPSFRGAFSSTRSLELRARMSSAMPWHAPASTRMRSRDLVLGATFHEGPQNGT